MSSILICLDIKPYLKKFLIAKSENKEEPVKFPRKSDYNVMLINLVTNYNSLNCIPVDDRENVLDYFKSSNQVNGPYRISIILPFNRRKDVRSYNYLSRDNKILFRNEVRLDFNFEFSRYLFTHLKNKERRTDVVDSFKKLYNISEDDLKSESLYRHSSRLLQDIEEN